MEINKSINTKINDVDFNSVRFGEIFTDHMFECNFKNGEWESPVIKPYGSIEMDPSSHVFHYGQAVFEGMKGYKDTKNQLWLFRPKDNYERLKKSCVRMKIPVLPSEYFFNGLEKLIFLENKWISNKPGASLYIRPFVFSSSPMLAASPSLDYKFLIICSPGGAYYSKSLSVYVEDKFSRAAPGGAGYAKAAGNYGASFYPISIAESKGFDQVLWTDASNHEFLEEAGTMNVFFRVNDTLLTAPTSERILDGVTRKSIIQFAEDKGIKVEVRPVKVTEIVEAAKKGELLEMFGAGTAAVISPILGFAHKDEKFELPKVENSYASFIKKSITDIQRNLAEDKFGWRYKIK